MVTHPKLESFRAEGFILSPQETAVMADLLDRLVRSQPRNGDGEFEPELFSVGRRYFEARRERRHFFPKELFSDPAWDMLLVLSCSETRGEALSQSSLIYAADVQQTTGLRWVATLEHYGLVRREPHPDDGRSIVIKLTKDGRDRMRAYLARILERNL
jgi:DNA-binding MarR family transcriptional regulator